MTTRFRVWTGSEMHEPPHDFTLNSEGEAWLQKYGHNASELVRQPKMAEVMFTTGLTDAEGEPIYEGDIFDADNLDQLRVVQWLPSSARFGLVDPVTSFEPEPVTLLGEVIGNVYETPELLEGAG